MAARSLCEQLEHFVSCSDDGRPRPSMSFSELLEHASECVRCAEQLDAVEDPALVDALLAADNEVPDDYLPENEDESDEAQAVTTTLLPSLDAASVEVARQVIEAHGAYAIVAALEAVSTLIRRHLRTVVRAPRVLEMRTSGDVLIDGGIAITRDEVALEIARFADLWTPKGLPERGTPRHPDDAATTLATWVAAAARNQPKLLRHFRAEPLDANAVTLAYVPAFERGDEVVERWAPERTDEGLFLATWYANAAASIFRVDPSTPYHRVVSGFAATGDTSPQTIWFRTGSVWWDQPQRRAREQDLHLGTVVLRVEQVGTVNNLHVTHGRIWIGDKLVPAEPLLPATDGQNRSER